MVLERKIYKKLLEWKNESSYVNVNSICGYENMVMIGDTSRDVNAEKNIGCHSILINRSGNPSQDFGQEYTVTNAMEILDLIQI